MACIGQPGHRHATDCSGIRKTERTVARQMQTLILEVSNIEITARYLMMEIHVTQNIPTILLVGHNLRLLELRAHILDRFFKVAINQDIDTASQSLARSGTIDLVILCHTLTNKEQLFLIGSTKCTSPRTKIIAIDEGEVSNKFRSGDAHISGLAGPHSLISEIIKLLRLCQGDLRSSLFAAVRN